MSIIAYAVVSKTMGIFFTHKLVILLIEIFDMHNNINKIMDGINCIIVVKVSIYYFNTFQ